MRVGVARVVGLLWLTLLAGPVRADGEVAEQTGVRTAYGFEAFCDGWMQKLRDRTAFNLARIEWKNDGDAVVGEHVEYGKERGCVTRSDPGKDPIGKITYREVRYRRRGPTQGAALAAPGTVLERFDVTEIFRFADGRWQY